MTQRYIVITACPLAEVGPRSFTVAIGLNKDTPSKRVPINTVDDCKAALAAFASELGPSGKPWHLSVCFEKPSGRKPPGFDKANNAGELDCHVNAHLAAQRAA